MAIEMELEILAALASRGVSGGCPSCGKSDWDIAERFTRIDGYDAREPGDRGDYSIRTVTRICALRPHRRPRHRAALLLIQSHISTPTGRVAGMSPLPGEGATRGASWKNTARHALNPTYLPVITRKIATRLQYGAKRERTAATEWCAARAVPLDDWAKRINSTLWDEASTWGVGVRAEVETTRAELLTQGVNMGGPGAFELLYFLTRLRQPATVLETGVAAGWSSRALLDAIAVNGIGHLYSSDFPFFRMEEPERYIGYAVPRDRRGPWTLQIEGDRKNIPRFLTPGFQVDLVHYDSDKSRAGREWFLQRIQPHLAPNAVLVMDDINDDLSFRDYSAGSNVSIFAYPVKSGVKYVGLVLPADFP
jgi:predicted O-methyltransferase YrrM